MTLPSAIQPLVASWSSYYGDHQMVSVTLRYLHLASTLISGGSALVLDRKVLRAAQADSGARRAILQELRGSHRVVVPSLVMVALSGLLLTAADADTFLASNLYWAKIGAVALLMLNGGLLLAAEGAAERSGGAAWGRLMATAVASLALWLLTLYLGTWLTVGA